MINVGDLLKGIYFLKFIPKCRVRNYSVSGWKISVLNGPIPGKPIALRRLDGKKQLSVSYRELEGNLFFEKDYLEFARLNGFKFCEKKGNLWYFESDLFKP